ncbi:universal stress protein [Jatrophihabitans lederbergiae]|uniref:Universal stress protein n=1 Tax=Jatrophihabitans lederbergiae TaxID=3075547 RepID=A0ABU2JGC4_9ACTN|nr:universal stress protein [Jatrophihabitans sp. DSM 44399]MDT0263524.1 universal stress protein [Jatrophihabitans sp. DSM 44399]
MVKPTVVVGFDASPESAPALRFATEEAQLRHARLLVVTAYDRPIDPDLDDFDIPDSNLKEAARARAEKALHLTLGRPPESGVHVDIVAAEREPSRVLLEHGGAAIMIVVGSHDRPMLQRLFGRPTVCGLLHGSAVPITIVPSVLH